MNGAEALIKALEDKGIDTIYGYPGGAVLPIYDALLGSDKIKHILVRDEQGASHAASGASRTSDKIGVCLATSGPGATNMVTGIATAYMDSVPMIAITGQVSTNLIGTDAFQEVDITGITLPIVKHSYLVKDASKIPQILEDAFHIANTGRKGPVLIDIPKDVQLTKVKYVKPHPTNITSYKPNLKPNKGQVKRAAKAINEAKRPVFFIGGGMISSKACTLFKEINEKLHIPVVSTLMGIGSSSTLSPDYIGMSGLHGLPAANFALTTCDLLINLGARFDDRTTIVIDKFAPHAKIIHVDVDPAEIGKNVLTDIPVVSDLNEFLEQVKPLLKPTDISDWRKQIQIWKEKYPYAYHKEDGLKPQYVVEKLSDLTQGEAFITTEVGQHQMWTAQHYNFTKPGRLITSGGLGTMGYGLPAALGVKQNNKDALVVNIAGDGSFQMNFQEIATCLEHDLDVKVILLDNTSLSLVRQLQYFANEKRYSAIEFTKNPDFVKLVEAFPGAVAYRVTTNEELDEILPEALNNGKFTLIDCIISNEERVYPVASPKEGIGVMTYIDDITIRP